MTMCSYAVALSVPVLFAMKAFCLSQVDREEGLRRRERLEEGED